MTPRVAVLASTRSTPSSPVNWNTLCSVPPPGGDTSALPSQIRVSSPVVPQAPSMLLNVSTSDPMVAVAGFLTAPVAP